MNDMGFVADDHVEADLGPRMGCHRSRLSGQNSAEHFIEGGGAQARLIGAGLSRSCGVEHGGAVNRGVGDGVAARLGPAPHGGVGSAGPGQVRRVGVVDADVGNLGFGVQNCGESGDQLLGGEESPALTELQPEPGADFMSDLARRQMYDFEERVQLTQRRHFGVCDPVVAQHDSVNSCRVETAVRNELIVSSSPDASAPAAIVTVTSPAPSPVRQFAGSAGYELADATISGTNMSRLAAMRARSCSGMSLRANNCRVIWKDSTDLPVQDPHTACSSRAHQE